jgi:hypothetical protein
VLIVCEYAIPTVPPGSVVVVIEHTEVFVTTMAPELELNDNVVSPAATVNGLPLTAVPPRVTA